MRVWPALALGRRVAAWLCVVCACEGEYRLQRKLGRFGYRDTHVGVSVGCGWSVVQLGVEASGTVERV